MATLRRKRVVIAIIDKLDFYGQLIVNLRLIAVITGIADWKTNEQA
jgi:hypothetical protein